MLLDSQHKDEIDKLLNEGKRVSEVLRHFEAKGIHLSRGALYRYKKSHFVSKRLSNNYLYSILIRTGNYSLLKSLERTVRIYETTRQCMCTEVRPEHLRRKGRVFIHSICGKWYPYDLGTHLKNKHKKGKKGTKEYAYVSATARSY